MTDWLSRDQRSRNMASIRSKGNATTERAFVVLLRSTSIKGWRRHQKLPGRPDFIFPRYRVAVFVDGCFWHGCPRCYRLPDDNRVYWKAKMAGNRKRDQMNRRALRYRGWTVLRIWEHALSTSQGRAGALFRLKNALLLPNRTQTPSLKCGRDKR